MRALLVLLVLIAAGGTGYWLLSGKGPGIAPPSERDELQDIGSLGKAIPHGDLERVEMPNDGAESAQSKPVIEQPRKPEQPTGDEPAAPPTTCRLEVRNVVGNAPIQPFRWRYVQQAAVLRGESETHTAELSLPAGSRGDLIVEADGMQPFSRKDLGIARVPATVKQLAIFLTPTASAEGITLMVKDQSRQPVPHVRVDAFEITDDNRQTAWQLGRSMWSRRTSAEDGNYTLPPLPAGEYGILLVATDDEGALLPMLAYRQTFTLTGSNGFLEDVPLEPACALQLELVELNGQPFDPSVHGNVTIGLNITGQHGTQRKWAMIDETGVRLSEANRVPGKGVIFPEECLSVGHYTLEIFINGDPRVHRAVVLQPGRTQLEKVPVR